MTVSAMQADRFFRDVVIHKVVWTVKDDGGIPSPKVEGGQRAMPFWSTRSRVERIIASVPAYSGFRPEEIDLAVWKERWLPGLATDGLLVGVNWSGKSATGYDLEPEAVLTRLRQVGLQSTD